MAKITANLTTSPERFLVECPIQGVPPQPLARDELVKWLQAERHFWTQLGLPNQLVIDRRAAHVHVASDYQRYLDRIIAVAKGDGDPRQPIQDMMEAAKDLRLIVGQGRLGRALQNIASRSSNAAAILAAAYSGAVIPSSGLIDELALVQATGLMSPALMESADLVAASDSLSRAKEMEKEAAQLRTDTDKLRTALNELHQSKSRELTELAEAFREAIKLKEPARYWQSTAYAAAARGWVSLVAFIIFLAVPGYLAWDNWAGISAYLLELAAITNGTFSLAPIAIITVPTLAYGWLLRHLSRIFIQNLSLADDANYRRVMTMTFLGLSGEENAQITETERALILNALFRPAPPHASEDGPPVGLLELVKPK